MRNNASVDNDKTHHHGFVINDDGTLIVFLSGGDIVFQFPNGKEVVRFADGTNVGWDSNSVLV